MNIAVIGTGYVGLVAGTCLAEIGHKVTCVDTDEDKIDLLDNGILPIYEPGLEELVLRNAGEGRLAFITDLARAIEQSTIVFIAVGTPPNADGSADVTHVMNAAKSIGKAITKYTVVVIKSTVPAGTARQVRAVISKVTSTEFDVVSNPEFLKEGTAVEDFMKPDRIVIGTSSDEAAKLMKEMYYPLMRSGHPILSMDSTSAEITKYAANAMLATRISFMNELANLCEHIGADIECVRSGIGSDTRIGPAFLFPGIGYGGSCFPKDVQAIIELGSRAGFNLTLLEATHKANMVQKKVLVQKIVRHFGQDLTGLTFAIWGLAFKPNTNDMREAPSLVIIAELLQRGAVVRVYDPVVAKEDCRDLCNKVTFCKSSFEAVDNANALVLVTEWGEFRTPDLVQIKTAMRQPIVFDGRNTFDPNVMKLHGFTYYAIGRLYP